MERERHVYDDDGGGRNGEEGVARSRTFFLSPFFLGMRAHTEADISLIATRQGSPRQEGGMCMIGRAEKKRKGKGAPVSL